MKIHTLVLSSHVSYSIYTSFYIPAKHDEISDTEVDEVATAGVVDALSSVIVVPAPSVGLVVPVCELTISVEND